MAYPLTIQYFHPLTFWFFYSFTTTVLTFTNSFRP
jgi:hypothetical protein